MDSINENEYRNNDELMHCFGRNQIAKKKKKVFRVLTILTAKRINNKLLEWSLRKLSFHESTHRFTVDCSFTIYMKKKRPHKSNNSDRQKFKFTKREHMQRWRALSADWGRRWPGGAFKNEKTSRRVMVTLHMAVKITYSVLVRTFTMDAVYVCYTVDPGHTDKCFTSKCRDLKFIGHENYTRANKI